jgi:hypothetical protein
MALHNPRKHSDPDSGDPARGSGGSTSSFSWSSCLSLSCQCMTSPFPQLIHHKLTVTFFQNLRRVPKPRAEDRQRSGTHD